MLKLNRLEDEKSLYRIIDYRIKKQSIIEQALEMEKQKDAKYNEMLETLEIVAKKLNRNGFPSLQNQIEKAIKDVKPI